jgi:hypothetical protein
LPLQKRAHCSPELIKDMHNSNRQLLQVTLTDGILVQEYKFYVLGFVPADVVRLKDDDWFKKLDSERVALVDRFFAGAEILRMENNVCASNSRIDAFY